MNTNKGFLLSTLLFILSACDPSSSPWLAGVPIKVTVDQSLPAQFDKKVVKQAVTDRVAQFGMQVSDKATNGINIVYDPVCKCPSCKVAAGYTKSDVLAYVNKYDFKNIYICPNFLEAFKNEDSTKLQLIVIGHEVCHVLGLDGHTGTGQGNLCSPGYQDHKNINPIQFSKVDIKAICDSGGIKSNVCY